MARFAFEAVDRSGVVVRGLIEAQARASAVEQLLSLGQTPLSLTESRNGVTSFASFRPEFRSRQADLLTVIRELSSLIKAGLPVERALVIMEGLAASKTLAIKVGQMLERVRAGEPLSRALRVVVPLHSAHIEHLVAAGEASGHLPVVLASLARNLDRAKAMRDRLISSLTYPAFLVLTLVAVLWIVFTSVLPRLTPMFASARVALPLPTLVLLRISQFIQGYGTLLLLATLAGFAVAIYVLRREAVRNALDRFLFTSPLLLRVPSEYEAAKFCRNLETLLGGGMALDRALRASRAAAGNRWFRMRVAQIQEVVEAGVSLKAAFARSGALPPLVVEFAAVGEETGNLAVMLGEGAEALERDVEIRLDRLMTLVLPLATLTMGLIVAGVMAAIVTGLLAVNDLAR